METSKKASDYFCQFQYRRSGINVKSARRELQQQKTRFRPSTFYVGEMKENLKSEHLA